MSEPNEDSIVLTEELEKKISTWINSIAAIELDKSNRECFDKYIDERKKLVVTSINGEVFDYSDSAALFCPNSEINYYQRTPTPPPTEFNEYFQTYFE